MGTTSLALLLTVTSEELDISCQKTEKWDNLNPSHIENTCADTHTMFLTVSHKKQRENKSYYAVKH